MEIDRSKLMLGVFLVLIGIFVFVEKMNIFRGESFLVFLGLGFICIYALTKLIGFLIPGCILTGLGLGIYVLSAYNIPDALEALTIFCGLAIGFYLISIIGQKRIGYWPFIPGTVILGVGVFTYIIENKYIREEVLFAISKYWPVCLIVLGVLVMLRAFIPPKNS